MLSKSNKSDTFSRVVQRKSVLPHRLEAFVDHLRNQGHTIATINGSFDLLHPGHLEILYQASQQADFLFVLLNTDPSIQAYKSPNRPVNPLHIRIQYIAALEMVDYVSYFDESDPIAILEKVKPDVHVNDSEYGESCIEADVIHQHGGKIFIVNRVNDYSTTHFIERIKNLCD